ncbi:MAG: sulfatase-like hydrolase/transferase [Lentisphaeria bacterium]|nr:sulfatase-like hydrolase/transferase [Lentisphaeria bacterium]
MAGRPNVLFLMTDHTNATATAPGSACLTPNLDALAAEGHRFARCHTTNAICSPARASLMTGTYPSTHGMWDCTHTQRREWVNVHEGLTYWSQILQRGGYANGYFGKWHVEQTNRLESFGWEESNPKGSCRLERLVGTEVSVPRQGYRDYLLCAAGDDSAGPVHHPAFDAGMDFIRRHAHGERPFCCFISTTEPHDPYVPPKSFYDLYDQDRIPLSPTLRDELRGKPEVLRRMQAVWKGLGERDWRRMTAAYWAVISFIDAEIGRVLALLRDLGIDRETVVVFTSDHGDMLGGHGLVAKGIGTSYEEVYNIPLILRLPGLTGGCEDGHTMTSLVDIGPTLLDVTGCPPLPVCHGRSLMPVLQGKADPGDWRDAYAEFFGQRFVYTQRLVWHGDWKYVFSPGGVDELYNLAEDPHELRNLAEEPACRTVLEAMCRRMWARMKAIGDESLYNTHYATLRTAPVGPLDAP